MSVLTIKKNSDFKISKIKVYVHNKTKQNSISDSYK